MKCGVLLEGTEVGFGAACGQERMLSKTDRAVYWAAGGAGGATRGCSAALALPRGSAGDVREQLYGVARIVRNEDDGLLGCGVRQASRSGKR